MSEVEIFVVAVDATLQLNVGNLDNQLMVLKTCENKRLLVFLSQYLGMRNMLTIEIGFSPKALISSLLIPTLGHPHHILSKPLSLKHIDTSPKAIFSG